MKKLLTAIVALLMAAPSFAQMNSGGNSISTGSLYYGIRLGVNFAGIGGDAVDLGTKTGMNLAGVVGLSLSETTPVFLESGLYYTERGAKKDKNKIGLTYFEVPLLIKYGVNVTDQISVLPYIGPYFSYGIAGKTKFPAENYNESSYDEFKHWDMGFKIGCGAEYNMLYAELGYQFGVANIAKDHSGDNDAKGHAFYFNVGVNF